MGLPAQGNLSGSSQLIEFGARKRIVILGLDIGAATTMLEGPVGKGSFIASAQEMRCSASVQSMRRISALPRELTTNYSATTN